MRMTELYISTYIDWDSNNTRFTYSLMGTFSYMDNIQHNPEEVFKWCMKLETHLRNYEWETIPNEDIKKMLQSCINVPTRRQIIPFPPLDQHLEDVKKEFFFHRNVEQILTRKYEENQNHDLLDRKQERQEDNKGYNVGHRELYQKQEFFDKKQKSSEDTTEYYAEIMGKSIHSRKQN